MFEPFCARLVEPYSRFPEFLYMRPDQENEALMAYCERVFTGRLRHPWVDSEVDCLRPRARVIKEVRVNFLLHWLVQRFPDVRVLLLLRHPCAVVQSRIAWGWTADDDLLAFLSQPALVDDFLQEEMTYLTSLETAEERHAAVWCISYLVPLRQFGEGAVPGVFYESLLASPETELPRLFALAGLPVPPDAGRVARRPSSVTRSDSAVISGGDQLSQWRRRLEPGQIERILAVVRAFGLDGLYQEATLPAAGARRYLSP
jgi:hypothetical protein